MPCYTLWVRQIGCRTASENAAGGDLGKKRTSMAKLTGALLSFASSGSIAKTLVYSKWKGRPYARQHVVPANPQTSAQTLTRNAFGWLQAVFAFGTASFVSTWQLVATGQVLTDRNAWTKANLSTLRPATDITGILFSAGAKGGLPPGGIAVAPGATQLTVTLTAPALPSGWTITQGIAVAVASQNPQSGTLYTMHEAVDESSPYACIITGLTTAQEYEVGGWFEFLKPDGSVAYGASLQSTGTPT